MWAREFLGYPTDSLSSVVLEYQETEHPMFLKAVGLGAFRLPERFRSDLDGLPGRGASGSKARGRAGARAEPAGGRGAGGARGGCLGPRGRGRPRGQPIEAIGDAQDESQAEEDFAMEGDLRQIIEEDVGGEFEESLEELTQEDPVAAMEVLVTLNEDDKVCADTGDAAGVVAEPPRHADEGSERVGEFLDKMMAASEETPVAGRSDEAASSSASGSVDPPSLASSASAEAPPPPFEGPIAAPGGPTPDPTRGVVYGNPDAPKGAFVSHSQFRRRGQVCGGSGRDASL